MTVYKLYNFTDCKQTGAYLNLSARFDTRKLLEGTFYVKEIQKERTRKRRKQMLVSWEGFDEKHNT